MLVKKRKCPICKKAAKKTKNPFRPFCSERCKKIDLGKWALGEYRIPGAPIRKESEEEGESRGGGGAGENNRGEKKEKNDVD